MGLRENTRANAKTAIRTVDLANATLENNMETPGLAGLSIVARGGGDPPAEDAVPSAPPAEALAEAEAEAAAARAADAVALKAAATEDVVLAPMRTKATMMVWVMVALVAIAVILYIRTENQWLHRGALTMAVVGAGGAWYFNEKRKRSFVRAVLQQ